MTAGWWETPEDVALPGGVALPPRGNTCNTAQLQAAAERLGGL